MKKMILALVVLVAFTTPAMANRSCSPRGGHGYARPMITHYRPMYVAPRPVHYYASRSMYYRPAPVYYSRPVYYSAPVAYQSAPPVVYTTPAPQPVAATQPAVITLQFPAGFVETGRRYHSHGSDAGTIDWVKGTIGDKKYEIEFNADGTRRSMEED